METERLLLRRYRVEDLRDFFELVSNPAVVRFEPYGPMTLQETEKELQLRMAGDAFTAVELVQTGKMIGTVYLGKREFQTLEIGFLFNEGYWGQGYASESCTALIDEAFSRGIHRICAECDPGNTASWRLLERLGFTREGHLKKNAYFNTDGQGQPIWKDTYIYSLLSWQ